jgi:predicted GIY-YIG superfamily endonuclease
MPHDYRFYIYILQSSSRRALYIGMTNNLHRRVFEHKMHRFEGFTDDYNAGPSRVLGTLRRCAQSDRT